MATKTNNGNGLNYNCEAFKTIEESIETALETSGYGSESTFGNTLVQDLAKKAFGVLISEKITTKQGEKKSESRYAYITGILPYVGQHELNTLEKNPEIFAEKFCPHPSRKGETSLLLLLYKKEDPFRVFCRENIDKRWIEKNLQVFEDFREFSRADDDDPGLSPFERVSQDVLDDFFSGDLPSLY